MESFYGGRQGNLLNVAKVYDDIVSTNSSIGNYHSKYFLCYYDTANETYHPVYLNISSYSYHYITNEDNFNILIPTNMGYTFVWRTYLCNNQSVSCWVITSLSTFSGTKANKTIPAESSVFMIDNFKNANSLDEVPYGGIVMIMNTNPDHPNNGKLFKRVINDNENEQAEFLGKITGPIGAGFSGLVIEHFNSSSTVGQTELTINNTDLIKGSSSDAIKVNYGFSQDESIGAKVYLGFQFPYLEYEPTINYRSGSVESYTDTSKTYMADGGAPKIEIIKTSDNKEHPFYKGLHIELPVPNSIRASTPITYVYYATCSSQKVNGKYQYYTNINSETGIGTGNTTNSTARTTIEEAMNDLNTANPYLISEGTMWFNNNKSVSVYQLITSQGKVLSYGVNSGEKESGTPIEAGTTNSSGGIYNLSGFNAEELGTTQSGNANSMTYKTVNSSAVVDLRWGKAINQALINLKNKIIEIYNNLNTTINTINTNLVNSINSINDRLNSFNGTGTNLETSISNINNRLNSFNNTGTNLETFINNINNNISNLANSIDKLENAQIKVDNIFPVGSIMLTINSTNPSSTVGGNWQLLNMDGHPYTLASNGGQSAGWYWGNNFQIDIAHMPSHTHDYTVPTIECYHKFGILQCAENDYDATKTSSSTGGNQPYTPDEMFTYLRHLMVYVWQRTG